MPPPVTDVAVDDTHTQVAVFAGGCFWGVQGVFQHVTGVTSAVSGYAGGTQATAHYDAVGGGGSGHAEAVQITYDPRQVATAPCCRSSSRWRTIRPSCNRQGPDVGTQYRSTIFPADAKQAERREGLHRPAERGAGLRRPDRHDDRGRPPVLPAEDYHQDYLTLHPDQPYIVVNDLPKIAELKRLFPARYRATPALVRARKG